MSLRLGIMASIAWAIAGSNAGTYLAVAPATLAYQTCVEKTDGRECQVNLHRDWAEYSGDRLRYAALLGLGPIPMAWLIAYCWVGHQRPNPPVRRTSAAGR